MTPEPKRLSDALRNLRKNLEDYDAEVTFQLANEGERADLWTEIDVSAEDLRTVLDAVADQPDAALSASQQGGEQPARAGEAIGAVDRFRQIFASAETHDLASLVKRGWTLVYDHPVTLQQAPHDAGRGPWRPIREAKQDGTIIVGRYWEMDDAPNGPYPAYILMQWDELENSGWMDPQGLDYIDVPVVDFMVVEDRDAPLATTTPPASEDAIADAGTAGVR